MHWSVAAAGCGRTALEPIDLTATFDAGAKDRPMDLPAERMDAPRDMAADVPMEHPPDVARDLSPDLPPPPPDGPVCVPKAEICNGVDDDCDGEVDEEHAVHPLPRRRRRFCVGGHYSECPRRCDGLRSRQQAHLHHHLLHLLGQPGVRRRRDVVRRLQGIAAAGTPAATSRTG